MNLADKWMELENIILSEGTQSPKDTYGVYSLISDISHKVQVTMLQFTEPKNPNNKYGPRGEWLNLRSENKIAIRVGWRKGTRWKRGW